MPQDKQQRVKLGADDSAQSAVERLNLRPSAVVVLLGQPTDANAPQVKSILSRVIAPFAAASGAVVIDSGASSGCAHLMGEAAAQQDSMPSLLGLLDNDAQAVDPHHQLLLEFPPEWTDKAKSWWQIVGALANGLTAALLFGGGPFEKELLLRFARHSWPVIAIQGSSGLADDIAKFRAPQAQPASDPELKELVDAPSISIAPLDGPIEALNRILLTQLGSDMTTLRDAWARHDNLSEAADNKQKLFKRVQGAVLILGMVATLLAILQSDAAVPLWLKQQTPAEWKHWLKGYVPAYRQVMHILIVLAPIAISVLVASNNRFREGNKWILFRAASEALVREIFRYRSRSGAYSDDQCIDNSRESKLAAKVKEITSVLFQSEANKTSVPSCVHDDPKRLTILSPENYVVERLENQIDWYARKTIKLYRRLKTIQLSILIAGGLGTFLAAVKLDVWVALTTAIATALAAKVETDQVENMLMQYNIALTNLHNVESWWKALSVWEKGRRANIDLLVDQTEKALEKETMGWLQQMQVALDKLTEKEGAKSSESN